MAEVFFHITAAPTDDAIQKLLDRIPDMPQFADNGNVRVLLDGDSFVIMRRTTGRDEPLPDPGRVLTREAINEAATIAPQIAALNIDGWCRMDMPTG